MPASILIDSQDLRNALTVNQLMEKITQALQQQLITGEEKVVVGHRFMEYCGPLQTTAIIPDNDGNLTFCLDQESEHDWLQSHHGRR